ncbi:hypothetical protein AGMMS50239_26640 [Bacteroidia bacterium]|nr:hypothetical protein AGMMS50239_26640 [Bacteroidia bacterium]
MKRKYSILSMIVAVSGLFAGCNDAEYGIKDNSIYLVEAASTAKSAMAPMMPAGADITVTVRLAKPVAENTEVNIGLSPEELEKYNSENGSFYLCIPLEHTNLGANAKVTVKAGEVAVSKEIHINYFDMQGKRYALPIAINGLSGNVETSASQSKFIYIVDKKLFVRTPNIKYRISDGPAIEAQPLEVTDPSGNKSGGWNLSLSSYTLEFWARLDKYNSQNFAIFGIYGNNSAIPDNYEFYLRFGDANSKPNPENGSRNYINWKAWGAQLTGPFELIAQQWNHWAAVYDGTNVILYRNGEEYLKSSAKYPGSNWIMHTVILITSHTSTNNTMNLSQIRLWKKALSSTQIKSNMYYEADPSHPDLEAYWKMDEGPDNFRNIFHDATGHGHDAIFYPNRVYDFSWTEPQNFE